MAEEQQPDPFAGAKANESVDTDGAKVQADRAAGDAAAIASLENAQKAILQEQQGLLVIVGHDALSMARASLGAALDTLSREIEHLKRMTA